MIDRVEPIGAFAVLQIPKVVEAPFDIRVEPIGALLALPVASWFGGRGWELAAQWTHRGWELEIGLHVDWNRMGRR